MPEVARIFSLGQLRSLSCLPAISSRLSKRKALTFLDLPPAVRDRIYELVFHDGVPVDLGWELRVAPYVPKEHFGLLCVSRQIYQEASAILYRDVHLGSDAWKAWSYLCFLGEARIRRIQSLTIYYHCLDRCTSTRAEELEELDWTDIFRLLSDSGANLSSVNITFEPCLRDGRAHNNYLDTRCRLMWDAEVDWFWSGLQTLPVAQEIRFLDKVPEFYVDRVAKLLGWEMKGVVGAGVGCGDPMNRFVGKLVNPLYGSQHRQPKSASKTLQLAAESAMTRKMSLSKAWQKLRATWTGSKTRRQGCNNQTGTHRRRFLDLPPEIRRQIYDHASEWVYKPFWPTRPARWNTGISLLRTSKLIASEALPSIYRDLTVDGGLPLEMIHNFGSQLHHAQTVHVTFTCFCPVGGPGLRHNNGSIYAARGPGADGIFRVGDWYLSQESLQDAKDDWTAAMRQIRSLPALSKLTVEFQSCCRWMFYAPRWHLGEHPASGRLEPDLESRFRCLALEAHFTNLLADAHLCSRLNDLSLAGNVPPSLALRLAQPPPESGMYLSAISRIMADFMTRTEAQGGIWELRGAYDSRGCKTPFAFPEHLNQPESKVRSHFVLTARTSFLNRWRDELLPEARPIEAGMQEVMGPVSRWSWKEVKNVMDCEGWVIEEADQ